MTEELDFLEQDSDGGSEEVVLTPAELIERLEQEMEFRAYFRRTGTGSYRYTETGGRKDIPCYKLDRIKHSIPKWELSHPKVQPDKATDERSSRRIYVIPFNACKKRYMVQRSLRRRSWWSSSVPGLPGKGIAWMNEKFAPELLESKPEIVECVMEQLEHMPLTTHPPIHALPAPTAPDYLPSDPCTPCSHSP
ncbi:hypothetical protein P7K49_027328 [Saguinus oedipus]|uniref:Uncharacterized protein n=1 Tax=Saguinus oedipus TaxID=9490 RepID=A0ABQ9U969_SAGOE|nr:hypothetical protein P7K49_027328 [Saguinus oedipus]